MPQPATPPSHNKGVNIYGLEGNKIPNPINWNITEDAQGNLSGTIEYHYDYTLGTRIPDNLLPQRGDYHPYDTRLQANQITQNYQQNKICKVQVQYVGMSGWTSSGEDIGEVTWELTGAVSDESIDTHPNFFLMGVIKDKPPEKYAAMTKESAEKAKENAYAPTGLVLWDRKQVEVDSNQRFAGFKNTKRNRDNKLAGVRSFKAPRAVCRINFSSTSTSRFRWIMDNIGRVYKKLPFSEVASAIGRSTFDDAGSWLLTNAGCSKYQGVYKYQVEFTLSGEGGWNDYIYKEGSDSNSPKK